MLVVRGEDGKGFIRLMRRSRRGLIAAANGSYGFPEATGRRTT
jgi:hypothetical protein